MKSSCLRGFDWLAAALATCLVDAMVLTQVVPKATQDAPMVTSSGSMKVSDAHTQQMPMGRKVVIALRGETFRYEYKVGRREHMEVCAETSRDSQLACTRSVVKKIIEPLEQHGNTVEVLFHAVLAKASRLPKLSTHSDTDGSELVSCYMDEQVFETLKGNSSRTVKRIDEETKGQADTMAKVFESINNESGGAEHVPAKFDIIMIFRSDLHWSMSIENWPVDFQNINVLSRCERGAFGINGGLQCVHDSFWMVPGSLYSLFKASTGHDRCFDPSTDPTGNGHSCGRIVRRRLAAAGHPNALGWLDSGRREVRDPNPVATISYGHPLK